MRRPQVVVFERDGRLARQLDELAAGRKWVLRESRQVDSCERLLIAGGPSVLVVRLGVDTELELSLIARAAGFPAELRTVAVTDGPPALFGLAWDLGAAYVVTAGATPELLPGVVAGLMGVG
ncbi:MAG: hypothetical protein K1X57_07585 [Gemmataceae bacterium]|nr:hypothetical protein [Gemmataceae bacterium]